MAILVEMDRAKRRDTLVRLMRRGGQTTVEALADRLAVSRRTVLRDLNALRERGFVIDADPGRGGGVRMDPSTVMVSAQLAADEVVALVLSVAVLRAAPWMPFSDRAERALSKIERSLPPRRVRELRRLLRRVVVGDPAASNAELGTVDPRLLSTFERAFSGSTALRFDYVDRRGNRSVRLVEPDALLVRAPIWYIIAWDCDKEASRLFRMDRIKRPRQVESRRFVARPIDVALRGCPDARASR